MASVNKVILVGNLGADPGPLLELDAATIRSLLYARSADLPRS